MFSFPKLTPFVKSCLIFIFSSFVITLVLENWMNISVYSMLALQVNEVGLEKFWQLWTYPIAWPVSSNAIIQVIFSLLFLWWALAPFEMRFGARRTLWFCLGVTVASGVTALLTGLLVSGGRAYLSGLGPVILGLISAFAWSLRGRGNLSLFGMMPLKAEQLVLVIVGFNVLGLLASKDFVDFVADMTAVAAGILFIQRPKKVGFQKKTSKKRIFSVIEGQKKDSPSWLN